MQSKNFLPRSLLLAKKVFFPSSSSCYTKTYYIHTSFYVPLSFSQLFFFSPNFVKGAELSTFEAQFCCILHIYTHITTTEKVFCFWLLELQCFAAISVLSQILIKRLSQLSTQLFSLGFKGKKTYKGESHFGKTLLGFDLKKFRIIHFI